MNFVFEKQLETGLHQFPGSSAALLSDSLAAPPIRKSSSAVDWSGAIAEVSRKLTAQQQVNPDWQSTLLEPVHKKSSFAQFNHLFGNLHQQAHAASLPPSNSSASLQLHNKQSLVSANNQQQIQKPPIEQEGGLVMSVSSVERNESTSNQPMSAAVVAHNLPSAAAGPQTIASKLAASASGAAQSQSSSSLESMNTDSRQEPKHAFLGGVFQRGFFAKPVVRTEEENYRYLMALDR